MNLQLNTFPSLEAQIASLSDDIAYINHDLDDGFRAELFSLKDIKKLSFYKEINIENLKKTSENIIKKELVRKLINKMVKDLIKQTEKNLNKVKPKKTDDIRNVDFNIASFSKEMINLILEIRLFLNKQMYNHKKIKNKTNKYKRILESLYKLYITKKINIPNKWLNETYKGIKVNNKQIIIDYISGMTDRYILKIYNNLKK